MYTVIFDDYRNFSELDMLINDAMEECGASGIISEDFVEDGYKVVFAI